MVRRLVLSLACVFGEAGAAAWAQPPPDPAPTANEARAEKPAARTERSGAPGPGELPGDEIIGRYLAALEKAGRLPATPPSEAAFAEALALAERRLVEGDLQRGTSALYALVESPRNEPYQATVAFHNAEFLLGRALLRAGAHASAERYLLRVLRRGPEGPYYLPAHRALVDLALETRGYGKVLALLEKHAPEPPTDARHERDYLRGRVAYAANDLPAAGAAFASLARTSRLYPSAAYFRGLVAARGGGFTEARAAFCEVVGKGERDALAFNVDDRYFAVKDLARLALGRLAHERDHYDEAYYFYFSIPEDSDRLAEALFEAAHSMFSKGEFRAAQAFADDFDKLFPRSPLRPEMAVLRANIALKSCRFDKARAEVDTVFATYLPLQAQVRRSLEDPARGRDLLARVVAAEAVFGGVNDEDGRIVSLLKLDDRFDELHAQLRSVDADIAEARRTAILWRLLGEQVEAGKGVPSAVVEPEAAALVQDIEALVPLAAHEPALRRRAQELLLAASRAATPPKEATPYATEERAAQVLATRLVAHRERVALALEQVGKEALLELDRRLRALLRQSRLVTIDAVVGRKKKLEIEIANIYEGRLPPELYVKWKAEGTLGDDEEYWPYEGDHWADEYENYK